MKTNNIQQCEICKIFNNPSRIKILLALRSKELTVSEIIKATKLSQSVVSQHLAILRNKEIVQTEKKGSWINYKIKYPQIMEAFDIMRKVTEKIKKN